MPYGEAPADAEPMVLVDGKWKPFQHVHSISVLWAYVKHLFADHADWLSTHPSPDVWTLSEEIDGDVQVIEEGDPRSTFFRYPTTKDIAADTSKSAMKEISEAGLLEAVKKSPREVEKVFALIVKNDAGEFVKGYAYEDESEAALNLALRRLAEYLYNLHAAMRWEICGGT